jgi:DNA-binding transcriptional regulator YiaG
MKDNPKKTHGKQWGIRREKAGLTQEELSTRAGLSLSKLRAIEAGREQPSEKEERALKAVIKEGPARR